MKAYYKSADRGFTLLQGDCIDVMSSFDFKFDMIFADPPYFLSNGGISVQNGKMVSVNKGDWDRSHGVDEDHAFNRTWLRLCREKLKSNGTIWVSGTYHNIFSIAKNLTELGYKILNCITWVKPILRQICLAGILPILPSIFFGLVKRLRPLIFQLRTYERD